MAMQIITVELLLGFSKRARRSRPAGFLQIFVQRRRARSRTEAAFVTGVVRFAHVEKRPPPNGRDGQAVGVVANGCFTGQGDVDRPREGAVPSPGVVVFRNHERHAVADDGTVLHFLAAGLFGRSMRIERYEKCRSKQDENA